MPAIVEVDLVVEGDTVVIDWRGDGPIPPPVSVALGATPVAAFEANPTVPYASGGTIVLPRTGLRTFAVVRSLQDGVTVLAGHRLIKMKGTSNLRDIGGYPLIGGGHTAWSVLLRGDAPSFQPDDNIERDVASLGLRSVIDLRSNEETRTTPVWWPEPEPSRVNLTIQLGLDGEADLLLARVRSGELRRFGTEELAGYYIRGLEGVADNYGSAITELGTPGRLPSLVHCAAGKDRTGLVIALVLGLCGVEREAILDDYAATETHRPERLETFRAEFEALGVPAENLAAIFLSPREALAEALDHIETRYGTIEGYLTKRAGVSRHAIERLRDVLMDVDS